MLLEMPARPLGHRNLGLMGADLEIISMKVRARGLCPGPRSDGNRHSSC